MVVTATDAISLYPKLNKVPTARIIGEEMRKSPLSLEELDRKEMAVYLALTSSPIQQEVWGISKWIPTRVNPYKSFVATYTNKRRAYLLERELYAVQPL